MTTVRPAEPGDAEETVRIVRQSIRYLCTADHHGDEATLATWLANKTPRNFLAWLANPDNFCVVAESSSGLRGVGLLHRSGEIRLFYLAVDAQRQGLGRKIHAAIEQMAAQWGLPSLHLESTAMARPFYEAMGYLPAGPATARFGVLQCHPYEKQLNHSPKAKALRGPA